MSKALLNTSILDAESSLQCSISNGRAMHVLATVKDLIPRIRGNQAQKSRLKMLCKMGRKALTAVEQELDR